MGMDEGSKIFLGDRRHVGRTKDILRGATNWGTVNRSNIEIDVIFEVWAFCGRGTKTDFKDRSLKSKTAATMVGGPKTFLEDQSWGRKKGRKDQDFCGFCFLPSEERNLFQGLEGLGHMSYSFWGLYYRRPFKHQKTKRRLKAYHIK